jgi:YHS domain-containing protein
LSSGRPNINLYCTSFDKIFDMKYFLLIAILFLVVGVQAQQPEVFSKNNLAINGYDPVAYFTEAKALKGNDSFNIQWNHARWVFTSKANLDSFKVQPEKYAPQFGGYCAYGMSRGYKAPTEGEAWSIVEGKLYLNYNVDVRTIWSKDQVQFIEKAKTNWKGIIHLKQQ